MNKTSIAGCIVALVTPTPERATVDLAFNVSTMQ